MYVCVHVNVCESDLCKCVSVCMHSRVCVVCMSVCVHVNVRVRVRVCVHGSMCVRLCVPMCMFMFVGHKTKDCENRGRD